MGIELGFCEFCQVTVIQSCADPADCMLGNQSHYVPWQDDCAPPPGKYRVRLENGTWKDAESVWEDGEFVGLDYLLGLWEWKSRCVAGYVPIGTVESLQPRDFVYLRHMLGNYEGSPSRLWGYRNYFCACPSGDDYDSMKRLEGAGLVRQGRLKPGLAYFHATRAGCEAAGLNKRQVLNALGDDE